MKDRFVYIATALECIHLIKDYTTGLTLETFLTDRKTQDAVIRNLEIIGQALKVDKIAASVNMSTSKPDPTLILMFPD